MVGVEETLQQTLNKHCCLFKLKRKEEDMLLLTRRGNLKALHFGGYLTQMEPRLHDGNLHQPVMESLCVFIEASKGKLE